MRQNNQPSPLESDIELTAQHPLAPFSETIDNLTAIVTSCESEPAANTETQNTDALQETSEIELTAEQMDALLEGRWP